MTKLDPESVMTIKKLHARGVPGTVIARMLGVCEGTVRYRLRRQAEGAKDGRVQRQSALGALQEAISEWLSVHKGRTNLAALHEYLQTEFDCVVGLRALQRFVTRHFPGPKLRARRRVETPPGAQCQTDWAEFRGVLVGGEELDLFALHMQLSFSRFGAIVWSRGKDQLAWQKAHNESFRRLQGVPASNRVDNEKTAIAQGAGAFGEINSSYRRYAQALRFHVDACAPRSPEHKGKVERRILAHRMGFDPRRQHWNDLAELQEWTDSKVMWSAARRRCPATGTTVLEAWRQEIPRLQPLPILPEPFDVVVHRPVGIDCMVHFESREYSVPFRFVGRKVEVRGCAGEVQVLAEGRVVARHARGTAQRVLIDQAHFEGDVQGDVLPPVPLGKMGRRLAEIAAMEPQRRPIDLCAALAEVAR